MSIQFVAYTKLGTDDLILKSFARLSNKISGTFSGMNYNLITENLIVGSQPQKPEDIDHLKEEQNVAYILNLQQDGDIAYWGIDFESILKRCKQIGIRHMRRPVSKISLIFSNQNRNFFILYFIWVL